MPDTPLTDFLIRLGTDEGLVRTFNASPADAQRLMAEAGLTDAQKQAVLSRDVSAIHYQLLEEGTEGDFFVPAGPVMDERGRFKVGPQGVMMFEPPVMAPVMGPPDSLRQPRKASGGSKPAGASGRPTAATKRSKKAKASKSKSKSKSMSKAKSKSRRRK